MDLLKMTARKIRKMVRQDADCFIVIDGTERIGGKSNAAIQFAALIDDEFSLDHIVYRKQSLIEKLYELPRYSAVIHDEIGLSAYGRDWMSKENKELRQASMVWGDQNKVVIVCLPKFWELDYGLRCNRTYLWVHMNPIIMPDGTIKRGDAEFHFATHSKWYPEPSWDHGFTHRFGPLPDDVYAEYRKQKAQAIKEALLEDTDIAPKTRDDWIGDAIKRGVSYRKIGEVFDLTPPRVCQIAQALSN